MPDVPQMMPPKLEGLSWFGGLECLASTGVEPPTPSPPFFSAFLGGLEACIGAGSSHPRLDHGYRRDAPRLVGNHRLPVYLCVNLLLTWGAAAYV